MISVIIPVYNVEKFIRKCLDSVLAQTYQELEIIIVDDGSTDQSGAICDEYAIKDKRIIVIHQKNGRIAAARNAGLNIAHGDYIGFVDSDDFVHPQMFELLLQQLKEYDADISVCWYQKVLPGEQPDRKQEQVQNVIQYTGKEALLLIKSERYLSVVPWNKLYRREIFEGIRYPVGRYVEDEFVIHHIIARCNKIVRFSNELYYYVQHNQSVMATMNDQAVYNVFEALYDRVELAYQLQYVEFTQAVQNQYLICIMKFYPRVRHMNQTDKNRIMSLWKKQTKEMQQSNRLNQVETCRDLKISCQSILLYYIIIRLRINMSNARDLVKSRLKNDKKNNS